MLFCEKILSHRYRLSPLLDSCQTCTVKSSREYITPIDVQFIWSKIKVNKLLFFVQMLSAQYVLTFLLKFAKLGTVDAPREEIIHFLFQVMCSNAYLHPKCCLLFLINGYQTLLQCLTSVRRLFLLLFGSQGHGQTTGLHLSIVHLMFYEPYA